MTPPPSADHPDRLLNKPIAVFDSGLGGLTVAAAVHALLPTENLVFLADRARVPYASLSSALISKFAGECFDFLIAQDPKAVVIACNTVSAVALESLAARSPVPVIGVIRPTAHSAAMATRSARVGVLATTATVKRKAYDRELKERVPQVQVVSNGCPLLVPLVEEGWTAGQIPRLIVKHYLEPILPANVDTLILGCTHYEYFRSMIQDIIGEHVTLVNTPGVTATHLAEMLASQQLLRGASSPGRIVVYATDITDALHRVVLDLFAESVASGRTTIRGTRIPASAEDSEVVVRVTVPSES